ISPLIHYCVEFFAPMHFDEPLGFQIWAGVRKHCFFATKYDPFDFLPCDCDSLPRQRLVLQSGTGYSERTIVPGFSSASSQSPENVRSKRDQCGIERYSQWNARPPVSDGKPSDC